MDIVSRRIAAVLALCVFTTNVFAQVADEDVPPAPVTVVDLQGAGKPAAATSVQIEDGGAVVGVLQAAGAGWVSQGPAPALFGQVENVGPDLNLDGVTDDEVNGAVHVVLPHPENANILYIGAVNGGVWKTTNALSPSPSWVPLTDFLPSLSIGALEFDPTDPTYNTLIAGVGKFSSFGRVGGELVGLYKTTDGGLTWTHIDGGGLLTGLNISAVFARGDFILAASTELQFSGFFDFSSSGIYRSTDGGESFELLGLFPAPNSFPTGRVFDMAGHPRDPSRVYAGVVRMTSNTNNGIYRSDDFGGTWTRVSNNRMNDLLQSGVTSNVEISMYDDGEGEDVVFCAILTFGQLQGGGVFRSTNRGVTWAELPLLSTQEAQGTVGLNAEFSSSAGNALGLGMTGFSITADSLLPHVVYVGGDRQPAGLDDCCGFPNAVGATDETGRLFRGDVFSHLTDKWSHLTHSSGVVTKPLGGTANWSAPHADSREMAFDVNGSLIQADGGGIYRRTLPRSNQGDWFSVNGNLATTEMRDIAWDAVSNIIVSGNQDTGTTYQSATSSTLWYSFSTEDGGDVLIDDTSALNSSTRYTSVQQFGTPRRSQWSASNMLLSDAEMGASGFDGSPQTRTPMALNRIDPSRIVAAANSLVNESFNRGDNFIPLPLVIGPNEVNFFANALDYGGIVDGVPTPDLLWAGGVSSSSAGSASNVLVRPTLQSGLLLTNYPGAGSFQSQPVDLEIDPEDGRICYVADQFRVIRRTRDMGVTWQTISQTLGDIGNLRQIEFVRTAGSRYLFVCSDFGVFYTDIDSLDVNPALAIWRELGTNLPNAPVWDIDHEPLDDIIVVGTMGRGAWTFPGISNAIDPIMPRATVFVDAKHTGPQYGTRLAPFRTVQAALDNVLPGGTIQLLPGSHALSLLRISEPATLTATPAGTASIR